MPMPQNATAGSETQHLLFNQPFVLELIMNTTRIVTLSIVSAVIAFSGAANAQSNLTRAEVKAEAAEAIRAGDVVDYETGKKLNELFPSAYPRQVKVPAVTARPSTPAFVASGDIEMDVLNQRMADAVARGQARDSQFAGKR